MKGSIAFLILILCLLLAACDSQEVDPQEVDPDACPAGAAEGETDYFPLEIGQTKTFDYSFVVSSPSTTRINGTLAWRVIAAEACTFGQQTFVVEESLDAQRRETNLSGFDSTYQEVRFRNVRFVVDDSLVYPGPYLDKGIRRFHPLTAPDTLGFDADNARTIYAGANGNGWRASVRVVRNEGLVSRSYFYHGGVQFDVYEDLVVKQE